jgi:hypothetical protein
MQIHEQHQHDLVIKTFASNLDKKLADDLPSFLPQKSGFLFLISGAAGSGKTTLLTSLMSAKPVNGVRQGYRKLFDRVIVISPTLGKTSMKNDPFRKLPPTQMFDSFTVGSMTEVNTLIDAFFKEGLHTCLILDDVGADLRASRELEGMLKALVMNRRHRNVSLFITSQKYTDFPPGVRTNASHIAIFKPKTMLERDAITTDLLPWKKDQVNTLFDYVFSSDPDDRRSFLFVDLSLDHSGDFRFFKRFNQLNFNF